MKLLQDIRAAGRMSEQGSVPDLLGDLEGLCLVLLLKLEDFEDEGVDIHSDAAAF